MSRKFSNFPPKICYDSADSCLINKAEYENFRERALKSTMVHALIVPKKSARTWTMKKGDLCKITLVEGSQVNSI